MLRHAIDIREAAMMCDRLLRELHDGRDLRDLDYARAELTARLNAAERAAKTEVRTMDARERENVYGLLKGLGETIQNVLDTLKMICAGMQSSTNQIAVKAFAIKNIEAAADNLTLLCTVITDHSFDFMPEPKREDEQRC